MAREIEIKYVVCDKSTVEEREKNYFDTVSIISTQCSVRCRNLRRRSGCCCRRVRKLVRVRKTRLSDVALWYRGLELGIHGARDTGQRPNSTRPANIQRTSAHAVANKQSPTSRSEGCRIEGCSGGDDIRKIPSNLKRLHSQVHVRVRGSAC